MIIGNGLLAKTFNSYKNDASVIIFASGVSNSNEKNPTAFQREINEFNNILDLAKNKLLVYFSTTSINNNSENFSPYIVHKINMEKRVSGLPHFIILRAPQIVAKCSNPYTLTNFLYQRILKNESFELQLQAERDLIDVADLLIISKKIIDSDLYKNNILNMGTSQKHSIKHIVSVFEKVLGKKANYLEKHFGCSFDCDINECKKIAMNLQLSFNEDYLEKIIRKYYSNK